MKTVKLKTDMTLDLDRWYVTNGSTAVGPVNLELLARGIEAGKVPLESFVRHEGWRVWKPLSELAIVEGDAPPTERSAPPTQRTDDVGAPARPAVAADILPGDALAGASDAREGLLLLLAAAVKQVAADGAVLQELRDEHAVVLCAHGPKMFDVLGETTRLIDPAVVDAAAGNLVVAEPTPGPAGQSITQRMSRLGIAAGGAFMIPVRPRGRLLGMLELGRTKAFRAAEIAGVEALVDAFVARAEEAGW
jgi:hypothetical protein